jgi:outer membrane protein assembly factor BamB
MKKLPGLLFALLCLPIIAGAQEDRTRLYTRPFVPSPQALDRLDLQLAWQVNLPTGGRRDGLLSVHPLGDQVLVQMRSGAVAALNAETGAMEWSTIVGNGYQVAQPLAFNSRSVFAIRGPRCFALDRKTGRLKWELELPALVTAAPAADEQHLFLCMISDRLHVYDLPGYGGARETGKPIGTPPPNSDAAKFAQGYYGSETFRGRGVSSVTPYTGSITFNPRAEGVHTPRFAWDVESGTRVMQAPLISQTLVTLAGAGPNLYPSSRLAPQQAKPYMLDADITAPIAQHGDVAYVATRDSALSALDLQGPRVLWRRTLGDGRIDSRPSVTDTDVYAVTDRDGLFRILRNLGRVVWSNPAAARFLSANAKTVFAADRLDRLMLLDRERGTLLGMLDTSAYHVPVSNELTDRAFLASNDGLLLCLRDRGYRTPMVTKKVIEKKPEVKGEPKPADRGEVKPDKEMKEPEKKEPEKKEPEKKEAEKEEKKD